MCVLAYKSDRVAWNESNKVTAWMWKLFCQLITERGGGIWSWNAFARSYFFFIINFILDFSTNFDDWQNFFGRRKRSIRRKKSHPVEWRGRKRWIYAQNTKTALESGSIRRDKFHDSAAAHPVREQLPCFILFVSARSGRLLFVWAIGCFARRLCCNLSHPSCS